ncbi:hypothetical protein ARTSIC4J27_1024 [Pseudarthrobacter siccitolerans]|uniref:Uncharacterized protein n=1 Tax=Pseudarthrobacter siccitolerans TaxID=861266 RepID=A0A024H039_9MICC|nr:hypothetical protein [Pseudarthrobacter siccitolerans]CCQ45091.1 hypothetical protein ARTSIC4J27_1024 [Pseudarthrobacter siccitolerans]
MTTLRPGSRARTPAVAPVQAPLTLQRALTVTGLVLGIAAAAHTAGGGHLPPAPVLALLAALVLLPVTVLARRRLSLASISGVLGAGQLALHTAFTSLPGPVDHCTPAGIASYGHHQAQAIPDCLTAGAGAVALQLPAVPGPVMVAAHILALAATALLLAHGEEALWRALAWLAPPVLELYARPLPRWTAPAPLAASCVPPLHPSVRTRLFRGPPLALARPVY